MCDRLKNMRSPILPVAIVTTMLGSVAGVLITLVVVSDEEESPDGWQESDSNADGEVDEWIIFKDGAFLKWERDNNFDGRRDDWTEFEDGVPVRSKRIPTSMARLTNGSSSTRWVGRARSRTI